MRKTSKMKQIGCIKYGADMNTRAWIDRFKEQGYCIVLRNGYAEIWK